MSFSGERLLIAATVDAVEEGERFETLPLHMSINRPFMFPEHQQKRFLSNAMGNLFDEKPVFQDTVGGKKLQFGPHHDIPAREMLELDNRKLKAIKHAEWFGLHALIMSIGQFQNIDDDPYIHKFSPHVTDTENESIRKGQAVAFRSVALFAQEPGESAQYVKTAYSLAPKESQRG